MNESPSVSVSIDSSLLLVRFYEIPLVWRVGIGKNRSDTPLSAKDRCTILKLGLSSGQKIAEHFWQTCSSATLSVWIPC